MDFVTYTFTKKKKKTPESRQNCTSDMILPRVFSRFFKIKLELSYSCVMLEKIDTNC